MEVLGRITDARLGRHGAHLVKALLGQWRWYIVVVQRRRHGSRLTHGIRHQRLEQQVAHRVRGPLVLLVLLDHGGSVQVGHRLILSRHLLELLLLLLLSRVIERKVGQEARQVEAQQPTGYGSADSLSQGGTGAKQVRSGHARMLHDIAQVEILLVHSRTEHGALSLGVVPSLAFRGRRWFCQSLLSGSQVGLFASVTMLIAGCIDELDRVTGRRLANGCCRLGRRTKLH